MKKIGLGDRISVSYNGGTFLAKVIGADKDGNTLVNGSPLFGEVPLKSEPAGVHPLHHSGDTEAAYCVEEEDEVVMRVPQSTSSEPAVKTSDAPK